MSVTSRLREWLVEYRLQQEFDALPAAEREALAHDAGLSEALLGWIMHHGTGGKQLPQMLRELRLSESAIRRDHPDVLRDMQATCAGCTDGRRCQRELDGQEAGHVLGYCPNATTLASLMPALQESAGGA